MKYKTRYSGSWYPDDSTELKLLIRGYFDNVKLPKLDGVRGIIVPHAGYVYSGQTAAYGFKAIEQSDFNNAVILAPAHKVYWDKISILNFSKITTPLGDIELNSKLGKELVRFPIFEDFPPSYINEHSFELELPFLQYINKDMKILPLIVGDLLIDDFKIAAQQLKSVLELDKTIFIVSSDFTHFGKNFGYMPFFYDIENNLESLDKEAIELITHNDVNGFIRFIERTKATICGKNPIILLMHLLKRKGQLLHYTTSGKMTGDYSNSVSYASIAL